jgi:hypothetical protein
MMERFHEFTLANADALNTVLYQRFMELFATGRMTQSHFFAGRFENIYIKAVAIPDIETVLNMVKNQAGQLLGIPAGALKAGFWFNAMNAGQRTAVHHHDENDELLSAVYYIRVPENSGDLILHEDDMTISIHPQAGKLVMFAPQVLHEVTVNRGSGLRLSVGMNVGPACDLPKLSERG